MTLVVVSILLAIVILYNLTNIQCVESGSVNYRAIKVLGFHNKEVTSIFTINHLIVIIKGSSWD